jgi:hypothetical protein
MDVLLFLAITIFLAVFPVFFPDIFPRCSLCRKLKPRFLFRIRVNTFAKYVNLVIDPSRSKRLTGMFINQQLKKMGILAEEKGADGKSRTVITGESARYGIESMEMNYNGVAYNKVVFNDQGKKFLLEHLEEIMSYK